MYISIRLKKAKKALMKKFRLCLLMIQGIVKNNLFKEFPGPAISNTQMLRLVMVFLL